MKAARSPAATYRRQLSTLARQLSEDARTIIVPLLRELSPQWVNDSYASTLEEAFDRLRSNYVNIGVLAKIAADEFVTSANAANKQRFYKALESSIGINLQSIIQNEDLTDTLIATTRENVSLIESIPSEYFKKIETIVFTGTTQGSTAGSLIKQIVDLGQSTTKRAKLIARDQSTKLNSALNQQRQQNLGVDEYIWRTADDGRVRESHASKNGQTFKWDKPPSDTGHPGHDIQCRCIAQAIIAV